MTVTRGASLRPRALVLMVLLGVFALAGCHRPQQQAMTEPVAAPTAKTQDEPSKAIPNDIYAEMPMFPGAEVMHVRKPKGAMREIVFELKNSPSLNEMVSFYKAGLKKGDFKVTSSLIMPARKTWSCDFQKGGRPGSVMLYPSDNDKTSTTIDLIYEMPSNVDQALLEPQEKFDVIGPGPPGEVAQNSSQDQDQPKK
jgi:hypothetical protein